MRWNSFTLPSMRNGRSGTSGVSASTEESWSCAVCFFAFIFMPGMKMKAKKQTAHDHDSSVLAETPDVPDLPFRMDGNVKEFHLIAEPVKQEIVPGRTVDLWGYNGSAPGPTIQVNQGDRVRVIVDNHLPEATSMHWHGFEVPVEMDGAPGSSQDQIGRASCRERV